MTAYVGNTSWKKFKKLYYLSKGIIDNYGLKYFFYVVNLQLRKQGFSIFTPDSKPVSEFNNSSNQEQYQKYLQHLNEKLFKETSDKSNILSYMPTISIILIVEDKTIGNIKNTIDSIKNQTYNNWEVIPFSINSIQNTSSKINELIEGNDPKILSCQKIPKNSFKEILNCNGDFVGFLHAGVELSKFSLYQFVKEINHSTEHDILYSDHDYIDQHNININPFFKPDWSPYLLRSMNYLSPFYIIKKDILEKIDLDLILNVIEQIRALNLVLMYLHDDKEYILVLSIIDNFVIKDHLFFLFLLIHFQVALLNHLVVRLDYCV